MSEGSSQSWLLSQSRAFPLCHRVSLHISLTPQGCCFVVVGTACSDFTGTVPLWHGSGFVPPWMRTFGSCDLAVVGFPPGLRVQPSVLRSQSSFSGGQDLGGAKIEACLLSFPQWLQHRDPFLRGCCHYCVNIGGWKCLQVDRLPGTCRLGTFHIHLQRHTGS